jgi:hypothetical protein
VKPETSCLIMTEYSPESYSPAGERIRHMALASGSIFDKVVVLTLRTARKPKKQETYTSVSLCTLNFSRAVPFPVSALLDPVKLLMFLVYGFMLCKRYESSCIVASMPPLETGVSAWFLAKFLNIRLIIDLRDDWESALSSQLRQYIPPKLLKPIFKIATKTYSFSSGILVITPTLATIIRHRGISTPIFVSPNGANTSLFFPRNEKVRSRIKMKYGLLQDKVIIIYCGSGFNPYYRLDLVLLSLRSLPNDVKKKIFSVFYLYNGIEHIRKLKNRLKIADNLVEIRDPLARYNVAEVTAACDVGLVPFDDKSYLRYATSSKIHEYSSTGLYVIGSGPKGGELDALLSKNPKQGLFVQPTVEGFIHAFSEVVGNGESLFDSSHRNIRYAFTRRNYDRQKIMRRTMKTLYTNLVLSERDVTRYG